MSAAAAPTAVSWHHDPAVAGFPVWRSTGAAAEVRFVGRGPERGVSRRSVLDAVEPVPPPLLVGARQVHGARVLEVGGVEAGGPAADRPELAEADALLTRRRGVALSVVTADCVPLLLEAGEWVAAVHAGWRGIVAGVVAAAAERLEAAGAPPPERWRAWIGPANAACCYEVGNDVAEAVAAASSARAVIPRPGGRPRLDLVVAVRSQLVACGVEGVSWLVRCTECDHRHLWSYRRDGTGAGRNHAFVWRP